MKFDTECGTGEGDLDFDSREEPTHPRVFGQVHSSLRCSVTSWIKRHSF